MVKIANLKRLVAYRFPGVPTEVTQVDDSTASVLVGVPSGKQGTIVDLTSPVVCAEQIHLLMETINTA